ncbi:MAG: hypothetical protein HWE23_08960 [Rhodobacteraceae bacterium]|nr:hypothetical protein [Paracoccaceae bacterium]
MNQRQFARRSRRHKAAKMKSMPLKHKDISTSPQLWSSFFEFFQNGPWQTGKAFDIRMSSDGAAKRCPPW